MANGKENEKLRKHQPMADGVGKRERFRTIDVRRKNDRCMEQRRSETKEWRNAVSMAEEKDG